MTSQTNKQRDADTPGPPAAETSAVYIHREEETAVANRMDGDDEPRPNPHGRRGPDCVLPKTTVVPLNAKPKSSKRRLKRKRKGKLLEMKRKEKKKKVNSSTIRLATWNVRTMQPGLIEDPSEILDARKTGVIDRELFRLNIDIAALQETRLADSGSYREEHYTFYWKGKSEEENRQHGVGFAVCNKLMSKIEEPTGGTERLLTLRLNTTDGPVTLVCAYAPTNCSSDEEKEKFYDELDQVVGSIPSTDQTIMLGDFNARVGADYEAWKPCLGRFGTGQMNQNGQRLLEFCTLHNLCITNTIFNSRPQHRTSWRHPRSKLWHQLDLIISRADIAKNFKSTRTFHSADCNTDHSLVGCTYRAKPKKFHRSKPPGNRRINFSKTSDPRLSEEFSRRIEDSLPGLSDGTAEEKWATLQSTIYEEAKATFGTDKTSNQDWFEANLETLAPIYERKRKAMVKDKKRSTKSSKQALKAACSEARKSARRCANDYWLKLSQDIQHAADTGNIRGVYDGIRKATGPTIRKTAPLKDLNGNTIKDKTQQMHRWVEHYGELYSRETKVTEAALEAVETLPTQTELDHPPTMEELMEAVNALPARKAPGKDGISAELIKAAKGPLAPHLLDLLQQCWREGEVPQDMRDSVIVTLYKNKGDRSDCNNHRGISLMSIVGKCFARVALKRLQKIAEKVYPESQCGFRSKRSTTDMVFSLRQLQEKCREQGKPLYMAFIDLTKAFDLVSRDGLFKVLPKIGCPPKLLSIIKSFHDNMQGIVQYDGSYSQPFDIRSGVKQGCVLAPTLFGIFFAIMLKHAFGNATEGIHLHTRSDGKMFNLTRLKAKTKIQKKLIRDMLFADDAAIVAHSQEDLQKLMDRFADACKEFGLTISIKKTEVMGQEVSKEPEILINNQKLVVAESFIYLGSTITNDLSLKKELDRRIGRASATFAKLRKRVWENRKLTTGTKIAVYRACVLSTLLYGSESWATYATQEKRLNSFHLGNLRRILGIKYYHRITNNEVLDRAKMDSIQSLLKQRRLRWLGHVHRMPDGRIPKDLLYGELSDGKRPQGRPKQCFRNVCRNDLRSCGIDVDTWEAIAANRSAWKLTVKKGVAHSEARSRQEAEEKRQLRKEKEKNPHTSINSTQSRDAAYTCDLCGRECGAHIGLISHKRKCSRTLSSS